jgi:hypothetical protein
LSIIYVTLAYTGCQVSLTRVHRRLGATASFG